MTLTTTAGLYVPIPEAPVFETTASPEKAIEALKSILRADLSVKMAEVDAVWGDAITLEPIQDYFETSQLAFDRYPACVMEARATAIESEFQGQENVRTHRIHCTVILRDSEDVIVGQRLRPGETLTKRVERTLDSMERAIRENRRLKVNGVPQCYNISFAGMEYAPTATVQQDLFEKEGTLLLDVYM